ncbi:MAG TPA: hypothetical protein VHR86_05225 [Armatimonadota bacterium]|nr:hypothetical protein [Armatimonadota bacterium]
MTADRRIFLAHPIDTYLAPAQARPDPGAEMMPSLPPPRAVTPTEVHRKRRSAALARERSTLRKKQARQLLGLGAVLVGAGIFAVGVALARWLVGGGTWADVVLAALAIIVLIPTGIYLTVSSAITVRLLNKEEQALEQELDALEQ